MRKYKVKTTDAEKTLSPQPEIDKGPKMYTPRQLILSGVKMAAIFGIIFLMLWLFENM